MTLDAWAVIRSLDDLVRIQTNLAASKLAVKRGQAVGIASLVNPWW